MGGIYELIQNIWIREVKLGDYDVRSLLICGERKVLVWDTLSHPQDMTCFLPLIGDKELVIVYSHADWDHIWGTEGLPFKNATVIGHMTCLERFSGDVPIKLQEKIKKQEQFKDVKLIAPTVTFGCEFSIDLGDISLQLHHLPGHTTDSIVAFIPEKGLLLMGDTIETPFPVVPRGDVLPPWIEGIKIWEKDPLINTVIPSHGIIGGREILQQNIKYLQSLADGCDIQIPEDLTDFYRDTHKANILSRGFE